MMENPAVRDPKPAMNWPLRLAQQAFASVLDRREHAGSFAAASRHQGARQALSTLSADERAPFERWLALQLITITADGARDALAALGSIDKTLIAAVRAQLAGTDAAFVQPAKRWHGIQYLPAHLSCTTILPTSPNRPVTARAPLERL